MTTNRSTMRRDFLALSLAFLIPAQALAQAGDMSCADYLAADAQMAAAMSAADRAAMQADKQAAAIDAKMRAYCKANPAASSSEAAMKAMQ